VKYPKIRNNATFKQRAAQFQLLLPARLPRAPMPHPKATTRRSKGFGRTEIVRACRTERPLRIDILYITC
jgi:hypothetical protein